MKKMVALMGPTAVGKTPLAIELAQKFNAEIICVDSIAVYRDFNIASAKPSAEEQQKIAHHLIDIAHPTELFSAGDFCGAATKAMEAIEKCRKNIFLAGGCGLYFRALFNGMFEIPEKNLKIKEKLEERIKTKGISSIYNELKDVDPDSAAEIHPHDRYRVLRALEVYYTTGKRFSEFKKEHRCHSRGISTKIPRAFGPRNDGLEVLKIGLNLPRQQLHQKISERTDQMFKKGLLEEVTSLLEKYPSTCKPFQSVGYKEVVSFLDEARSAIRDLKEQINQKTRALVRRQLTWFRAERELQWFEPSQTDKIENLVQSFLNLS